MEKQESEAQKHQRGRLGASKNTEGQAKGQDAQQVGKPIYRRIYARPEACRLRTLEGTEGPYSWNKDMLQKYYV